jgi:glucan phosphoethanolaminetransferase (alkaline phosphatase superfamily)
LNLIDAGYFPFSSKRSGIELFAKQSEGGDGMMIQYVIDFWYLFLLWIGLVIVLIWLYRRKKTFSFFISIQNKIISFFSQIIIFGLLLGLTVLGARGGMYLRPLRSVDASRFVDPSLVPLVLNTPFQIISTSESQAIRSYHWMNEKQALQLINPIKKFEGKKQINKNVVIIILESFGREYIGFYNKGIGYTPFLDSLAKENTE